MDTAFAPSFVLEKPPLEIPVSVTKKPKKLGINKKGLDPRKNRDIPNACVMCEAWPKVKQDREESRANPPLLSPMLCSLIHPHRLQPHSFDLLNSGMASHCHSSVSGVYSTLWVMKIVLSTGT